MCARQEKEEGGGLFFCDRMLHVGTYIKMRSISSSRVCISHCKEDFPLEASSQEQLRQGNSLQGKVFFKDFPGCKFVLKASVPPFHGSGAGIGA